MLLCEIRDIIGSGFQSNVYNSKQQDTVLKVAKILSREAPLVKFIKLAKDSKNNPYLPKIYNFRVTDTHLFVKMEKLQHLNDVDEKALKKDPVYNNTIKELLKISPHLDLHPNNYMVRKNNQVVIIDPFQPEPEEVFDPNKPENQIILIQTLLQPLQKDISLLIQDETIQELGTLPTNTSNVVIEELFKKIPLRLQEVLMSLDGTRISQIRTEVARLEQVIYSKKLWHLDDMISYFTFDFYVIAYAYDRAKMVLKKL